MEEGYFSIKRDLEIVRDGGFMCFACSVGKEASEQSPDKRYCQGCYAFLLAEAALLSPNRGKPSWVPVPIEEEAPRGTVSQQKQREVVAKPCTKGITPPQTT